MSQNSNSIKTPVKRPLSPHLQVYRLPYNALMSISGRGVGIILSVTLMVLLGWFIAVVWNPPLYDQTMTWLDNPYTKYAMMFWAFLVFFYIGNGLRHLMWDMGIGLNEKSGIISGNIVLLLSVILTFGLWQITCGCWAGHFDKEQAVEGEQNDAR